MRLLITISMTTRAIPAGLAFSLARTTVEMHRQISALSLALMVISRTLVRETLVQASEIPTEIDPDFSILYASTIEIGSKNDHAYM